MTSEQIPNGTPPRRRMAGYRPLAGLDAAKTGPTVQTAPESGRIESPGPRTSGLDNHHIRGRTPGVGDTSAPVSPVSEDDSTGAPPVPGGSHSRGRKTRMAAPSAAASTVGTMNGTGPAPVAVPRMGSTPVSAPETSRAPEPPAKGAQPLSTGTRMGSTAASATALSGHQQASEQTLGKHPGNPRERPGWSRPVLVVGSLVILAIAVVLGARWLRTLEGVQEFIATYDGHASQRASAPEGMPWWMGWQHFFNMFFIVLIIRTGLQVRTERKPPAYWTAKKDSFFSPAGNTPKKVSLSQWLHQCLDVLWVANGLIFIVLLFTTGHWMRIVPTSWDIVPNMVSAGIQYASLDWPVENGWVHYNALQVVAYFVTVFVAAPLAVVSGIRFSTWWPERAERLNRAYPVQWARALHLPVMLYFVGFTIVHVFLVFFTGALANLNHMYTARDAVDWWGLVIFAVSLVMIAVAWFLARPMFTTPIASRMGKVSK